MVIGDTGVVGAFLVRLLVADGHHVVVIDKRAAPGEHWVMDAAELTGQGAHLLADTDALIFALPELTALDVLARCAGHTRENFWLINTCSIQRPFQDLAAEICPSAVSVGINPMFSPKLDCAGRPVVVCEDGHRQGKCSRACCA